MWFSSDRHVSLGGYGKGVRMEAIVTVVSRSVDFTYKSVDFTYKSVDFTDKSVDFTYKSVDFTYLRDANNLLIYKP